MTVARARRLRRALTEEERKLWYALRRNACGVHVRRQHPIPPFVADFACVAARIVIEVDGGQHGSERDAARDEALRVAGWKVLRYWNNEVRGNLDGVVQDIMREIEARLRAW